jgi:hypothetical protein
MFPAAFQMPIAGLLLAGGLVATFAGYRLFKLVLGVYGFLLGALVATSMMSPADNASLLLAAGVGGLVGAVLLIAAYFIGVALIGAGLAALVVHLVWAPFGGDPHPIALIVCTVAGALGALALQRYVIVIGTAFGGAWTMLVGGLALRDDTPIEASADGGVWLLYPLDPAPEQLWVPVAWLVLGLAGTIVQLAVTGKKQKR